MLINSIGDTFDFLNNYSDEEGNDEEAVTVTGPFSSGRGEQTYG